MRWFLTNDVDTYVEQVTPLLCERPVENTLPLSVLDRLSSGERYSEAPMLFGWYGEVGVTRGAVLMTPPFELLLGVVPPEASDALVSALLQAHVDVPGVNGDVDVAERFASAWLAADNGIGRVAMRQRL